VLPLSIENNIIPYNFSWINANAKKISGAVRYSSSPPPKKIQKI